MKDLKPSLKSGEFWLYAVVIVGLFYLNGKGVTPGKIASYGQLLVVKFEEYTTTVGPVALAVIFAAKRTYLKYQQMKNEVKLELAKSKGGEATIHED